MPCHIWFDTLTIPACLYSVRVASLVSDGKSQDEIDCEYSILFEGMNIKAQCLIAIQLVPRISSSPCQVEPSLLASTPQWER